ncbi:MAG: SDR family NAD(P)-dependent oxidoreductase [Candidatus Sericytochromatia bacterium]
MTFPALPAKWALITGASGGLGAEFARQLACQGAHLVLTARNQAKLETLAQELRQQYGVRVEVLACDLGVPQAVAQLCTELETRDLQIEILINNAGMALAGDFLDTSWEDSATLLQLNLLALTQLTRLLAAPMVQRGRGWILQVASLGAYVPCPGYAVYAASKAFVLHFGEALHHELRGTGVQCCVLAPGVTATGFMQAEAVETAYTRRMVMEATTVVEIGLSALFAGRASVVPGRLNRLSVLGLRLLSRRRATALAARSMDSPPRA